MDKEEIEIIYDTQEEAKAQNESEGLVVAPVTGSADTEEMDVSQLKDVMRMMSLDGMWFKKNFLFLLFIMAFFVLYITNRYEAQREMIAEGALLQEVQEWRYRSMTMHSDLTTRCRQSQLEQRLKALGDSTLQIPKTPPYEIVK